MLFNSRSVSFLIALLVGVLTSVFLRLIDGTDNGTIIVGFCVSFLSAFALSFLTLELLIFKELRRIYRLFDKISGHPDGRMRESHVPIKQISKQLFAFANSKEREIEKLRKLESFRREFLADISHELKTPVFAAQGFIHTLLDGAIDDAKVRDRFLGNAARSLDDLDLLVQDLITISQMETGEIKMQYEVFPLQRMCEDIFEKLGKKAENRAMNLQYEGPKEGPAFIHADPARINQVVTNLVDNAIKYGRDEGTISVRVRSAGGYWEIEVHDDGPGISTEHQDRVFQRFYRVDKSRSKEKGGTGLGLSIVKHIIEAHKGKVTLHSSPEIGTSFRFPLLKGRPQ